jgi:NAD(P)-dependent dehydrogenase (short-subunit alcohol dehydrogenase family)
MKRTSYSDTDMQHFPKVVIVTGAGRGIGAAIARRLAREGAAIAVNWANSEDGALAVVADIEAAGGRALAIQGDVARETDILRLFETAENELGPIEGLVNNAGITGGMAKVIDVSADQIERVLTANVTGSFLCAREAMRRMAKSRGGPGGVIVNVSSIAARIGGGGEWVHYAVSKGAIDTLTRGLAKEAGEEGVRVNAVAPGLIDTEMGDYGGGRIARMLPTVPLGRGGQVGEVAEAVTWLLSPASSYVHGAILDVSGGR